MNKKVIGNEKNIIFYNDEEGNTKIEVLLQDEDVWLNIEALAELFSIDRSGIVRHINNIYKDNELNENSTCAKIAHVGNDGKQSYNTKYYNLDMIISVGYRVKSQNGVIFRKWATSILKDYMMKGYAINEKRIEVLNKTVSIQSRMLASTLGIEEKEVLNVIEAYSNALSLLDDYDHGCISKPKGKDSIYQLTYEECRTLIDSMKYGGFSDVFGVEKEPGKLNGIIAAVYQNVFGQEIYPSIEEKAANLLYFLVKDHPFVDGCKRIGASIFLEFLNKNQHLIIDGKQIISDSALVAITLMIAESRPEEKETMVKLVMNFLKA